MAFFMGEVEGETVMKLAQYHSASLVSKLEGKSDLLTVNPDLQPRTSPEG